MDRYPSIHERSTSTVASTVDRPPGCRSPSCRPPSCPGRSSPSPSSPIRPAAPSRPPAAPVTDGSLLRVPATATLAVVAQVPDIGALPTGEPVAIVRVEARARITRRPHVRARRRLRRRRDPRAIPARRPRVEALGPRAARRARAGRRAAPLPPPPRAAALRPRARRAGRRRRRLGRPRRGAPPRRARPPSTSAERVELVLAWAREHLAELQVAETIRNDVTEGVDKQQREYLLRQQLSAIRKELGEGDDDVVGEYRTKLDDARRGRQRQELHRQGDRPAGAHQRPVARAGLDPHVAGPRLRAAVGRPQRRHHRPRRRPDRPRRGPLRPRRREVAHRRVPRRAASCAPSATSTSDAEREPPPSAAPARSSRSSGPPASARPASASRSPGRWAASSCASPSAASATRPRSAATAARTSARSRAASSRRSPRPAR